MFVEVGGLALLRLGPPLVDGASARLLALVRQDDVSRSGVHQVDLRAHLHIEARRFGRIHLRQDHDVSAIQHAQMARLPQLVRQLMHRGQRLHHQPLGRRMLLRQAKQAQRQVIALVILRLSQVAALFQTQNHAEDLRYRPLQPPCRFTHRKARRSARE
jgi:hypothetical protein